MPLRPGTPLALNVDGPNGHAEVGPETHTIQRYTCNAFAGALPEKTASAPPGPATSRSTATRRPQYHPGSGASYVSITTVAGCTPRIKLAERQRGGAAGVFAAEAALSFLRGVVQRPCRLPWPSRCSWSRLLLLGGGRGGAAVVVVELRRVELAQVRHIRVADDLASAEGDGPLERALWISCPMCLFSYPIGGTAVWMCP